MSAEEQTDIGHGHTLSENYGFETEKERIDIAGSDFDPHEFRGKLSDIAHMLSDRGFEPTHSSCTSLLEGTHDYQVKNYHRPKKSGIMYVDRISQQGSEENDISVGINTIEQEDEEIKVSPIIIAKDHEGYAAIGAGVEDANWYNNTASDHLFSFDSEDITMVANIDQEDRANYFVDLGSPEGIISDAVHNAADRIEENVRFLDDVEYSCENYDGNLQPGVRVNLEGGREEVANRMEAAYVAIQEATEKYHL